MQAQTMLITGAANGIGAAVTALAASRGHRVVAADRDTAALDARWSATPDVRCETLDVTHAGEWSALVAKLEGDGVLPDVLVNIAGVLRSGQTGVLDPRDVDLIIDVNVKGMIFGANAVAAGMRQRRRGHIINLGSIASLYPTPGTPLYATSKFAIRGFSIAAAGDLRPYGIAVTLVGPGPVKTAMLELQRNDPDAALTFSGKRALTPEEVAAAILGPVLDKRPVEYFLPFRDEVLGKISNVFPRFFLSQVEAARKRGKKNFTHKNYR
ncbi:MAG: SDR family oxidoreductase [Proteobacteria bacterium]|nr:SDR family oxidoreductase [Pseudomonadota bacterium]